MRWYLLSFPCRESRKVGRTFFVGSDLAGSPELSYTRQLMSRVKDFAVIAIDNFCTNVSGEVRADFQSAGPVSSFTFRGSEAWRKGDRSCQSEGFLPRAVEPMLPKNQTLAGKATLAANLQRW